MNDETQKDQPIQVIKEEPMVKIAETGEQTQITPRVKEVADSIKGESIALAMKISDYIKSMDVTEDAEGPDFTRTADEILEGNEYNGCNEAGVIFASLLRAKGVPTTYIQALNRDAVRNYTKEKPSLNGHVFLEANLGNETNENKKVINSTTGEITDELPENMIEGARGLDPWDIELKEGFSDLQKMFEEKHQQLLNNI